MAFCVFEAERVVVLEVVVATLGVVAGIPTVVPSLLASPPELVDPESVLAPPLLTPEDAVSAPTGVVLGAVLPVPAEFSKKNQ